MTTPSLVLELKQVCKHFPGVKALQDVDLRLFAGEVHALLGENGAGKSTLVKVMTGALAKSSGEIYFNSQNCSFASPAAAQQAGISTVYQEVNLLPNLSVAQNLFLGHEPRRFGLIQHQKMQQQAQQLLLRFKLNIDVSAPLAQYSVAVQQLIAIARGVAMSAKVLVLDEPTASLDSSEVQMLFDVMRQLRDQGVAIVFITHFLDQVYQISDRITVLRNGSKVGEYLAADLPRARLIEAMLGKELQQLTHQAATTTPAAAELLLVLNNIAVKGSISGISLTVAQGQAVGLAGLLGSGRTEVCRAVYGVDALSQGEIQFGGRTLRLQQPADAIKAGIALCPEERKTEGIIGPLSIRENIMLALQARRGWWRYLPVKQQQQLAAFYIDKLHIATPDAEKPIEQLSGGNQQKVILARWLAINPQLLILDEPTRGIDIGAHAEILLLIKSLCQQGMSLLVTSSELEELVAFAGKVVVLRDRQKVTELSGDTMTAPHIMQAIAEG
ncbi:sugar ABC transporter ATP-binding protein [Rheinheimera hassiensis]|uniref:sugar ABC transporter ATP-binding protein n=1 Tax=Rheinheimera hassiensis TaxID=1193627 RepID=UPI001F05734E|nr:sugar ABC transporter ATP-binding protein [Rheinheimera hassiensis]